MAKRIVKEIDCPHCKEKVELQMWDSINVSLNPALKDKIKNGTIFDWTCPQCGKTTRIMYPFLYIDMIHTFMIWFGAPGQCNPELYQNMTLDGYQFRQARNFNELVEKAAIFENQLDDHVIELMKLSIVQALYKQTEGGTKAPLPAILVFRSKQEDGTMIFSALYQNAPGRLIRASETTYNTIRRDLENNPSILKGLADGEGKFQQVNFDWAKKAMTLLAAQRQGH